MRLPCLLIPCGPACTARANNTTVRNIKNFILNEKNWTGVNVIKLFSFAADPSDKCAVIFDPGNHFQLSLIFCG